MARGTHLWLSATSCGTLWWIATCAQAQAPTGQVAAIEADGVTLSPEAQIVLAVDDDDDDDDDVVDGHQADSVPLDDVVELKIRPLDPSSDISLAAVGGLRVLRDGAPLPLPIRLPPDRFPLVVGLQAPQPSSGTRPLTLLVTQGDRTQRVIVRAVQLTLLDASNKPLSPATSALALSHRVTNDLSLPRGYDYRRKSADPRNVRIQITDSEARGMRLRVRLHSMDASSGQLRHSLPLELSRPRVGMPFRSRFIRLVGDAVDRAAPGVAGQVLQVALRDRVRVLYEPAATEVAQDYRVSRPGRDDSEIAARTATVRVVVLRSHPGGPPVIGVDELSALRIVRDEVAIANEVWLQCNMTFGPPEEVSVMIADPPPTTLISVSDGDGLPAAGDGHLRVQIEGRIVGPVPTRAGDTPRETALNLASALQDAGFVATVTINPSTVFGAGESADVLVQRRDGTFVRVEAIPGVPLSTDKRQRLSLGGVDLGDGLEEFNNMTAQGGSLEERTLIKALADDDPSTIDLFIVNRFTHGTRQGEAFIEASAAPIVNAVVLDRNGLRQRQTAWTMAHEIGHVLLNQPLHPDNIGPDKPSLLMDSDNNRGTVNGPKRLVPEECTRVRYESGLDAEPQLLHRYAD